MLLAHTEPTAAVREPSTDAEQVATAVARLGPLDREALLLRVRGHSIDEIATTTGTTPAMVRVRLGRAAHGVESRVGHMPTDGRPVPHVDRPSEVTVADAEVGITPMLHDRLAAALERSREVARVGNRRRARLAQAVLDHAAQLASLGTIAGLATMTAALLATAA